ncbi:MAG: fibronectin type III domain-containing protein [Treponema sp.]|nr:fibronectin type III domain-containing protein [Treponema sp.]
MKQNVKFTAILCLTGSIVIAAIIGFSILSCDNGRVDPNYPGAVSNLIARPGNGQVFLFWAAPSHIGGSSISHYEVSIDNGTTWENAWCVTSHTFSGLINGTTYAFRVRAVSAIGRGVESMITARPNADGLDDSSLDGFWALGIGEAFVVNIDGSTGVYTKINMADSLWRDAVNKGFVRVNDLAFQNLVRTSNLTWNGQELRITWDPSSPNIATGVTWINITITMSVNCPTFQSYNSSTGYVTWTRSPYY